MEYESGLIFVKLGGSLLTDKQGVEALRRDVLERLAAELAGIAALARGRIVVGHGSGSFGHVAAAQYEVQNGISGPESLAGVSLTQDRAATLHRYLVAALLDSGALPFSLPPSALAVSSARRPVSMFLEPLERALDAGFLPVTHGDVALDRSQGAAILSTEAVFEYVIGRLVELGRPVSRVFWLGETDGVYDRAGNTAEELSPAALDELLLHVQGASGTDVTGGMRLRLETAGRLASLGVPSTVLDGRVPGRLADAVHGREVPGTRILAGE